MKNFLLVLTLSFFIFGNATSEEVFKCKKDLYTTSTDSYDVSAVENAIRLIECWIEIENKPNELKEYFLNSDIFVFIYNADSNLYLAADDNPEANEIPAVEKGLKLCAKDSGDCAVWTAHVANEIMYMYDGEGNLDIEAPEDKWLQHAYKRRIEMTN